MNHRMQKKELDKYPDIKKFANLIKAQEQGYFSFTVLKLNKLIKTREDIKDTAYAWSGASKAFAQVYKSEEALGLFKQRMLRYR